MRTFILQNEQIEFLKKMYQNESIVQKVLVCEKSGVFTVDTETKIDFMDFVEDESVAWMDENYEPSENTLMLESIRDSIYYQTN